MESVVVVVVATSVCVIMSVSIVVEYSTTVKRSVYVVSVTAT